MGNMIPGCKRERKKVFVDKQRRYFCVCLFCCEAKGEMGRELESKAMSRQVWLCFSLRCQKYPHVFMFMGKMQ